MRVGGVLNNQTRAAGGRQLTDVVFVSREHRPHGLGLGGHSPVEGLHPGLLRVFLRHMAAEDLWTVHL